MRQACLDRDPSAPPGNRTSWFGGHWSPTQASRLAPLIRPSALKTARMAPTPKPWDRHSTRRSGASSPQVAGCRPGRSQSLSGEAGRRTVLEQALADGGFTPRELTAAPPPGGAHRYARLIDHQLSWALTDRRRDGLVENPARSFWKLAGAALEPATETTERRPGAIDWPDCGPCPTGTTCARRSGGARVPLRCIARDTPAHST
jgi:hypothetical protein